MEDEVCEPGDRYSMCKGPGVGKSLAGLGSRKETGESARRSGFLQSSGRNTDCPPWVCPAHAPHSRALDQLLQVLHLAAQLLSRREVLAHFHEESCNLVAAQKASRPPPQPMQDAGLHSRCRDTVVSQQALPTLPCTQLRTPATKSCLGELRVPNHKICESITGKSTYASLPPTPSKRDQES